MFFWILLKVSIPFYNFVISLFVSDIRNGKIVVNAIIIIIIHYCLIIS